MAMAEAPPSGESLVRRVTDHEVARFRAHGWVHLEALVCADAVARMLAVAQEVMGDTAYGRRVPPPGGRVTDYGRWVDYHYIAFEDGREPFRSLVFSEAMAFNAQRLAARQGGIRYFADTLACKTPESGRAGSAPTVWHQDLPHFPHDRVGHVAFWLALDEIAPEQGSLRFLSGGHAEGPLGRDLGVGGPNMVERNPWLLERYAMSPQLHFAPGDTSCHGALTIHSAPENRTNRPRWTYIFSYVPDDVRYTGAPYGPCDALELEVNEPFAGPRFPLLP